MQNDAAWGVMEWAGTATIVSTFWLIITTSIVIWQIRLQRLGVNNDQKRFMRETLTYLNESLQDSEFRKNREEFFAKKENDYSTLDSTNKSQARSILNRYGMLARMVEFEAIDELVFKDYWRSTLLRDWERLSFFVSGERKNSNNPKLFTKTELLVKSWGSLDV